MSLFADDCSLLKSYSHAIEAEECLNSDLITIKKWADRWLVKFSYSKTIFINFSKKVNKSSLKLQFNEPIAQASEHKHLGLFFSQI